MGPTEILRVDVVQSGCVHSLGNVLFLCCHSFTVRRGKIVLCARVSERQHREERESAEEIGRQRPRKTK